MKLLFIIAVLSLHGPVFGEECADQANNCAKFKTMCIGEPHFMKDLCAKTCGFCQTVPCDKDGGEIKQFTSCPILWYADRRDPSQCTEKAYCDCKDGFTGTECEHDCMRQVCPKILSPVCVSSIDGGSDITYPNKCLYLKAECKNKRLYFLYNGRCQDDSVCRPFHCPMDTSVTYIDDPNNPGCKLCVPDFKDY